MSIVLDFSITSQRVKPHCFVQLTGLSVLSREITHFSLLILKGSGWSLDHGSVNGGCRCVTTCILVLYSGRSTNVEFSLHHKVDTIHYQLLCTCAVSFRIAAAHIQMHPKLLEAQNTYTVIMYSLCDRFTRGTTLAESTSTRFLFGCYPCQQFPICYRLHANHSSIHTAGRSIIFMAELCVSMYV